MIRDIVLFIAMAGAGLYLLIQPPQKQESSERIQLTAYIPSEFGNWESRTHDTSDYQDQWQSINELMVRTYHNTQSNETINFIAEYGSDLRRNFSFHFPEICLRAGGNEVIGLKPCDIELSTGKSLRTKCLYVKGMNDALIKEDMMVAYWLVVDNRPYYRTFFIKLDQMLAGLLRRSRKGFLLRVDYDNRLAYQDMHIHHAQETIREFVKDLFDVLGDRERAMFFGDR